MHRGVSKYHHDGCLIEDLGSHLVHDIMIPGDADVRDKTLTLLMHGLSCLGLRRCYQCLNPTATRVTQVSAQATQPLFVLHMHR